MTTNKMEIYISNIQEIITENQHTLTPVEIEQLAEVQLFMTSLSELFGHPVHQGLTAAQEQSFGDVLMAPLPNLHAHAHASLLDGVQLPEPQMMPETFQGFPVGQLNTLGGPVPVPAAPGAFKLSSNAEPVVDGCIASQPKSIMEQAAQAKLNQLLGTKKKQESLTESLKKQIEATPVVEAPDAPEGQMTLADFVKMNEKKDVLGTVTSDVIEASKELIEEKPQDEMTLAEFVASQQATQAVEAVEEDAQAQLNRLLSTPINAEPEAPAEGDQPAV
jgi:hypothetical protein